MYDSYSYGCHFLDAKLATITPSSTLPLFVVISFNQQQPAWFSRRRRSSTTKLCTISVGHVATFLSQSLRPLQALLSNNKIAIVVKLLDEDSPCRRDIWSPRFAKLIIIVGLHSYPFSLYSYRQT